MHASRSPNFSQAEKHQGDTNKDSGEFKIRFILTHGNYTVNYGRNKNLKCQYLIVCNNIRAHYFISCSIFFQIIEYRLPPSLFKCCTKMYVKRYKGFSENKYLKSWLVVQNLRIAGYIAAHFPKLCILTILLDKCQTKSFADMNIFIKEKQILCITFIINII